MVEVNGARFMTKKNLGPLSLTKMMSASRTGDVRGLLVGNDVYYWDAYYATHDEFAASIGVPYSPDNRLQVMRIGEDQEGESKVIVDLNQPVTWPPKPLERLTVSPNFYFLDQHGKWKNGQELAA